VICDIDGLSTILDFCLIIEMADELGAQQGPATFSSVNKSSKTFPDSNVSIARNHTFFRSNMK